VINTDTINLPVCAFGAGMAHVAALALVLPLMITLPGESMIPKTIAIPVAVVTLPRAVPPQDAIGALMAGEDAEAVLEPVSVPEFSPGDITGALQESSPAETLDQALPEPDVGIAEAEPEVVAAVDAASGETVPSAVAPVDMVMPPLPARVRRDEEGTAIIETRRAPAEVAPPVQRAAPKRGLLGRPAPRSARTAKQDDAPYKGSWEALFNAPVVKPVDRKAR
jgi:hypothetical protein